MSKANDARGPDSFGGEDAIEVARVNADTIAAQQVYMRQQEAQIARCWAALTTIADMTCDHGPGPICPREVAAKALLPDGWMNPADKCTRPAAKENAK